MNLRKYSLNFESMNKDNPKISIIIPTKNSAKTLESCLISLQNQSFSDFEIIIVDNFSTDTTRDIGIQYTDTFFQKWSERTTQKNYGISQSKGEYLCFIDSDMILSPQVLEECIDHLGSHPDLGWVTIPERSVGKGLFVRIRDFERSFYVGTRIESARFFRKSDVVKVGGFEEDIIFFEESLLPQKIISELHLNCNQWIQSHIDHQEGNICIFSWLKKKFYYGKSLNMYKKRVKEIGIESVQLWQMWILSRYMIFFREKRFYSRPFLAFWVLILKTLEFGAGGIGLLFQKLTNTYGK